MGSIILSSLSYLGASGAGFLLGYICRGTIQQWREEERQRAALRERADRVQYEALLSEHEKINEKI